MEENFKIEMSDGEILFARAFRPKGQVRGTLLHVHGLSEHTGRFVRHWESLTDMGFQVLTYDHRGHGQSTGKRFVVAPWEMLVRDVAEVVKSQSSFLGKDYFVFGHSMGGSLTTTCVLKGILKPKAAILSAPAFAPGPAIAPWVKIVSPILMRILPDLTLKPTYDETVLTTIREEQLKAKNDPLFSHRSSPTNFVRIFDAGKWNLQNAYLWHIPLLMMYGKQDVLTNPATMKEFYDKVQVKDKELYEDADSRHELLFDIHSQEILNKMAAWLSKAH